jgi:hypothetical protein
MSNPFIMLRDLFPGPSVTEGEVTDIAEDGTVIVTTVTGGSLRCSSAIAVQEGETVAVQDQRIIEIIEDLQTFTITI